MSETLDLGRRVELVPMDPHCRDITLALYRWNAAGGAVEYLIHSYNRHPDAAARVEFLRGAAAAAGGMLRTGDRLRHVCGEAHLAATRRLFLEVCKAPPERAADVRPLSVMDRKSNAMITVTEGYKVGGEGVDAQRLENVRAGLIKLAELNGNCGFPCGRRHDELIGMLLPRALNVRAALREEESAASRGVLVAPSAQK